MSEKTVFISYRRDAVGKAFARSVKQALTHEGYDVFLDVDCMDSGKWAEQILTEVPKRAHFLLLLTPDALDRCEDESDWVRREFHLALQSQRNIVPVREESVDLVGMRAKAPESMQELFGLQIAEIRHGGFEADIETLIGRYIPPHKAPKSEENRAETIPIDLDRIDRHAPEILIGREKELEWLDRAWRNKSPLTPLYQGGKTAHGNTCGNVLVFVAMGGEGKTSLVAKWAADLAGNPDNGLEAAFAWSFYSQGSREQSNASADLFLREALIFFGDPEMAESPRPPEEKGKRLAELVSSKRALLVLDGLEPLQYPPTAKGQEKGRLKDPGLAALLKSLALRNMGLCLATTRYKIQDLDRDHYKAVAPQAELKRLSKEAGVELLKSLGVKGRKEDLEKLVEDARGHALTLNLLGSYLREAHAGDIRRRDQVRLEEADAEEQSGHAFHVMDAYVRWFDQGIPSLDGRDVKKGGEDSGRHPGRECRGPGDRDVGPSLRCLPESQSGHDERGKSALALLRLMGLFDRPTSADCLKALMQFPPIPGLTDHLVGLNEAQFNLILSRLEETRLVTVNRDGSGRLISLDAHPLLREYFSARLQAEEAEAWRSANERLFRHLCEATQDKDGPSLEELQPLYQAVVHGCRAGLQQEALDNVYVARILRGREHYTTYKLGAFGMQIGALACFFETKWSRVSPSIKESVKSWLLSEVAITLRALGQLTEALEPMRTGLEMDVHQGNWKDAALSASNMSELYLTLGEVVGALANAEQAVAYADRSRDADMQMVAHTLYADALHQAGLPDEAKIRFGEAEAWQDGCQRVVPLIYPFSQSGFHYCDLLLAPAERAAWQATLHSSFVPYPSVLPESCRSVSQLAAHTLNQLMQANLGTLLLTVAIKRLTLCQATLYEAILEGLSLDSCHSSLSIAVDSLRRAGDFTHLPRGLLTRSWLRRLEGQLTGPGSAQEDLDEAWEIAERGPMPLYLTDIHLHRARLFCHLPLKADSVSKTESVCCYPWQSPQDDLREARRLIEKHGYWRRREELEDAEAFFRRA